MMLFSTLFNFFVRCRRCFFLHDAIGVVVIVCFVVVVVRICFVDVTVGGVGGGDVVVDGCCCYLLLLLLFACSSSSSSRGSRRCDPGYVKDNYLESIARLRSFLNDLDH